MTEGLADLISRRMTELGVSYREASARTGGGISHSHLAALANGQYDTSSDSTLEAVALALDLPVTRVRKAAGLRPKDPPFIVPDRARRLSSRERKLVLNLIDTLLAAREGK